MTITFTSLINHNGEDNKIEFTAPVKIGQRDSFTTYEFKEPSVGEMNLIEVKDDYVVIFAGLNTLEFSLGEVIKNQYMVPNMPVIFIETQLHDVEIKENEVKINYTMSSNGNQLGDYKITLKINKEN